MRVLLISPRSEAAGIGTGGRFIRIPPLNLPFIAALTPPGTEVSIVDETIQDIPQKTEADLVGISTITATASRAYRLGDQFRAQGKTVVLGGMHPSCLPEEALQHADAVVIGEAEGSWRQILRDFEAGKLKRLYYNEGAESLNGLPYARRDLLAQDAYLPFHTFQTTRGCPYDCRFCSVTRIYGSQFRSRPADDVLNEIEHVLQEEKPLRGWKKYRFYGQKYALYFVDDNIFGKASYATKLFQGLKSFRRYWTATASLDIVENEDLIALAAESGCLWLGIGFESLSQETLDNMRKRPNRVDKFKRVVEILHRHGICIFASFVVGNDEDTNEVFPAIEKFSRAHGLDMVFPLINTPLPGTQLATQLQEEARILTKNWDLYDCMHVVFRPNHMNPQQLSEGHRWLWKKLYTLKVMAQRVYQSKVHLPFTIVGNLAVKSILRNVFTGTNSGE